MDEDSPYYLHQLPVPGEELFTSLALVNTRFTLSQATVDLLEDTELAHLWLVRRDLLPDDVALGGRQHSRLLGLREALRDLFAARTRRSLPPEGSLEALNAALAMAPSTPHLAWTAHGPRRNNQSDRSNPVGAVLSLLAEDGVDLLTGPEAAKLSECGAQGCTRWFLRTHGARRWCTTKCGNRVRAARHYATRKGQ